MKPDVQFVFIVGRGRSGTSLLQTILNTHPAIAVAPEAQFIMYLRRKYRKKTFTPEVKKQFLKDLWLEERLQNWHLDAAALEEAVMQLQKPDFAGVCREVYTEYGRQKGKSNLQVAGDKNPHYALYLDKLNQVFPQAKFIHIIRDPRDTVLSYQKVNFDADGSAALAHRWNIYNRQIMAFKQGHQEQFYTLRFEDLLQQPEKTLQGISRFLGIAYNPVMLDFYKQEQDWDTNFRQNLKQPLNPELAQRWKSQMPAGDVDLVTAITAPMAQELGYEAPVVKLDFRQKIGSKTGKLYAYWVAFLEQLVYKLPLRVLAGIIAIYRKLTVT